MGRDNRIVADHGVAPRIPFLDERVVTLLQRLRPCDKADLRWVLFGRIITFLSSPSWVGRDFLKTFRTCFLFLPDSAAVLARRSSWEHWHSVWVCPRLPWSRKGPSSSGPRSPSWRRPKRKDPRRPSGIISRPDGSINHTRSKLVYYVWKSLSPVIGFLEISFCFCNGHNRFIALEVQFLNIQGTNFTSLDRGHLEICSCLKNPPQVCAYTDQINPKLRNI